MTHSLAAGLALGAGFAALLGCAASTAPASSGSSTPRPPTPARGARASASPAAADARHTADAAAPAPAAAAAPTAARVLARSPGGWERLASPFGRDPLYAVSGSGPDDVWILGPRGVARFDGHTWTAVPGERAFPEGVAGIREPAASLYVAARDDVWVAAASVALHWHGARWTAMPIPVGVQGWNALHGTAPDDVWVVGSNGAAARWNGRAWSAAMPTGATDQLVAVYAAARTDAWLVGMNFVWGRWDGRAWRAQAYGPGMFTALAGTGPRDVWAVGWHDAPQRLPPHYAQRPVAPLVRPPIGFNGSYAIQHWDGRRWSVRPDAPAVRLNDVAACAPDNAWAVGLDGFIAHWDGTRWAPSDSGVTVPLGSVWCAPTGEAWVTTAGNVLHHAP